MKYLLALTLIAVSSLGGYALSLDSNVDYWGDGASSIKKTEKLDELKKENPKEEEVINAVNILSNASNIDDKKYQKYIEIVADNIDKIPDSTLENLPMKVILAVSKYQKEQQIKKKKTLVAYLYLKNPSKFRDAYWDWYTWQAQKAGQLTENMVVKARENSKMVFQQKALIDWAKNNGVRILYFCNNESQYCQLTMPYIEQVAKDGIRVFYINTDEHPNAVRKWSINAVPTTIAVIPDRHIAVRYTGAFSNTEALLYYFYTTLNQNNNPLLRGYVQ